MTREGRGGGSGEETTVELGSAPDAGPVLTLAGPLDMATVARAWRDADRLLGSAPGAALDARGVTSCDAAGLALLDHLVTRHGARPDGLPAPLADRLSRFRDEREAAARSRRRPEASFVEGLGAGARGFGRDVAEQVAFLGAVVRALGAALRSPRLWRASETLGLAHRAGVEALGIVGLINFLLGLIIAFVGGDILARFGAQVFVADAIGIVMVRELGPIMTAIVVAGRSGSAFAAELGTMRVNEEVDALETMGLAPVPLLVLPRVVAGTVATPLLALYGMLAGVSAGLLQMSLSGFPLAVSGGRLLEAMTIGHLVIGVAKSVVFGALVSAVGCLRGLQAGRGPSAVGLAATRAVVAGIVLVIVADAVFAVVTTVLGV